MAPAIVTLSAIVVRAPAHFPSQDAVLMRSLSKHEAGRLVLATSDFGY
jgi:hypothetical protein